MSEVDRLLVGRNSPWPGEVEILVVRGDVLTEAALFHRASRTLVLTDLIENFEPKRVHGWFFRLLIKFAGIANPDGKAPIDMRLSFLRRRKGLQLAIRQMLAWHPERVIVSHGRWYVIGGGFGALFSLLALRITRRIRRWNTLQPLWRTLLASAGSR